MPESSRAAGGAALAASAAHASVKKARRAPVAVSRDWTSLLALVCQSGPGGVSLQRRWLLSPPKSVVATLIADHFLHVRVAYHPASGQLCALFTDIARSFGIGNNAWNPSQPNRFPATLKIQLDGNVIWALPLPVLADFIVWAHRINERVLFQSNETRPTQARAFLVQTLDLLRDLSAHLPLHPQPPSLPEMRSLLESFMGGSDYAHIGRAVFQTADGSVRERHADGSAGLPLALSADQEEQKRMAPVIKQTQKANKAATMEENRQRREQGLPPKRVRHAKGKAAALDKPLGKKKKQSKGGKSETPELSLVEQERAQLQAALAAEQANLALARVGGYQPSVPLPLLAAPSAPAQMEDSDDEGDAEEEDADEHNDDRSENTDAEGDDDDEGDGEGMNVEAQQGAGRAPLPRRSALRNRRSAQARSQPHQESSNGMDFPSPLSSPLSSPPLFWAAEMPSSSTASVARSSPTQLYPLHDDEYPTDAPLADFASVTDNHAVDGHFGAMGSHTHTLAYAGRQSPSFSEAAAHTSLSPSHDDALVNRYLNH